MRASEDSRRPSAVEGRFLRCSRHYCESALGHSKVAVVCGADSQILSITSTATEECASFSSQEIHVAVRFALDK